LELAIPTTCTENPELWLAAQPRVRHASCGHATSTHGIFIGVWFYDFHRSTTAAACQSTPVVLPGFESFVTPLPASTVPLRFVPCTVSMTPAVPHGAQASSVAPRMATPTLAAPSATATPHAATDVTTS
jgi:hypothetical protein